MYPGSKSWAASTIWERFGNPHTYVEAFAGSAAVLLARPHGHPGASARETINDTNGWVTNLWRSVQQHPDEVTAAADWPGNQIDMSARYQTLIDQTADTLRSLRADPTWCDPRLAGWWIWLIRWSIHPACITRGSGGVPGSPRRYAHRTLSGIDMARLADRLKDVIVMCSDWTSAVSPARLDLDIPVGDYAAVLLDPPYRTDTTASGQVYAEDDDISSVAYRWAIDHGDQYRIAYCCRVDDYPVPPGWSYVNGRTLSVQSIRDSGQDQIMFSPACTPATLF